MKESNEIKETLEGSIDRIDSKRRSFAKTGIAVPVIMTLASRPVFGAQCLSEMLSTTMSGSPNAFCAGGQSPGFWKALTGATDPYFDMEGTRAPEAWDATLLSYGTLNPVCYKSNGDPKSCNPNKWENYSGGTAYNSSFLNGNTFNSSGDTALDALSLREWLNSAGSQNDNYDHDYFHLIAGLLNARFYDNSPGYYMFSEAEFWEMYNDPSLVPSPYNSLRDLIELNYHNNP